MPTNAAGKSYLAQKAREPGVISRPSGLLYKHVEKGSGTGHPLGDTPCDFHYRGTLIDGTEFDSSYKRGKPSEFTANGVVPGCTEGYQLMVEGDKMMFYIPSELAYGDGGIDGLIPPGSVLVFEVQLVKVKGPTKPKAGASSTQAAKTSQDVPVISLGFTSAPKVSLKKINRAGEPFPFDWVLCTFDGLMNFLTNDFLGFYDFNGSAQMPVPGSSKSVSVFQSGMHCVRQDDPTSQPQTGYTKPIEAFQKINAHESPVLFVRVAATCEEIKVAGLLQKTLVDNFGLYACLLMIVDDQGPDALGPVTVQSEPNVLLDFVHTEKAGAAYSKSILLALQWAANNPIRACNVPDLENAYSHRPRDSDWGLFSNDGRPIFINIANGAQSVKNSISVLPMAISTKAAIRSSMDLEMMPSKAVQPDPELEAIPLVSLGTSPRVKRSMKEIGRGKEAFPFDWCNTTLDGLMNFLLRDFKNFFDYTSCIETNGVPTAYRTPLHSFWHDDIADETVKEGYRTRIANLMSFNARDGPMMFVREAASSDEVRKAGRLLQVLNGTFGMWATILLIVDHQGPEAPGFIVVEQERGLMINFCDTQGRGGEAPYADMIHKVLLWSAGRAMSASKVTDLADACAYIKHMDKGNYVGNQEAFDGELAGEDKDVIKMKAWIGAGEAQDSELMEQFGAKRIMEFQRDPESEHVQLVSLGCSCAPKMSFKAMGRGAETLPFDWMRTTLQGVYTFMTQDFEGYFDFTTRQVIPVDDAPPMIMFRGQEHSFWHDDPTTENMREKYMRRIERFKNINARDKGVLFVRGAATTDEVADAGTISRELVARFGPYATLLLILDFQGPTAKGAVTVEAEPNLMLFFNDTRACHASSPHIEPVREALDWVVGRKVLATSVPTVMDAMKFVHVKSHYGLKGTTGVPAFESVLDDPRINEVKQEEVYAPSKAGPTTVPDNVIQSDMPLSNFGSGGKLKMNFQGARRSGGGSEPAPEPPSEPDRRFNKAKAASSKATTPENRKPQLPDVFKGQSKPASKAKAATPTAKQIPVNVSPVKKGTANRSPSLTIASTQPSVPSPRSSVQKALPSAAVKPAQTVDSVVAAPSFAISAPSASLKDSNVVKPMTSYGIPGEAPDALVTSYGIPGAPPVKSAPMTSYGPPRGIRANSPPPPPSAEVGMDRRPSIEMRRPSLDYAGNYAEYAQIQQIVPERTVADLLSSQRVYAPPAGPVSSGSYVSPVDVARLGAVPQVSSASIVNTVVPQVSTVPTQPVPQVSSIMMQSQIGKVPQVSTVPSQVTVPVPQVSTREAQLQIGKVPQVSTREAQLQIGMIPQVNTRQAQAQIGTAPQVNTRQAQAQMGAVPQVSTNSIVKAPQVQVPQVSTVPSQQMNGFPSPQGNSIQFGAVPQGSTGQMGRVPQVSTVPTQVSAPGPVGSVNTMQSLDRTFKNFSASQGGSQAVDFSGSYKDNWGVPRVLTQHGNTGKSSAGWNYTVNGDTAQIAGHEWITGKFRPPGPSSRVIDWTNGVTYVPEQVAPPSMQPGFAPLQNMQTAGFSTTLSAAPPSSQAPLPLGSTFGSVPPSNNPLPMGSSISMNSQRNMPMGSVTSMDLSSKIPQVSTAQMNMNFGRVPQVSTAEMNMNFGRVPQVSTNSFSSNNSGYPPIPESNFPRSLSMSSPQMQPGMRASISGVDDSNQHLKVNGKICTLVSFDAPKSKWIIRLPEGSTARVPSAALTILD